MASSSLHLAHERDPITTVEGPMCPKHIAQGAAALCPDTTMASSYSLLLEFKLISPSGPNLGERGHLGLGLPELGFRES